MKNTPLPISVKVILIALGVVITVLGTYVVYTTCDYYFGEEYHTGYVDSTFVAEDAKTEKRLAEARRVTSANSVNEELDDESSILDGLLGPQQHIGVVPTNTKAWLTVDGVDIHDPVMQANDNNFYLNHNELGVEDKWGCYYFTANNNVSSIQDFDRKTLIFGHSNGNATHYKFSTLKKFKDKKFAEKNQFVHLTVNGVTTKWQIFAECDFPIEPEKFMDINPTDLDFKDEILKMKELSYNKYDTTIQFGDKVLYLVTCTGQKHYDTRYVLCAKLVA